MTRGGEASWIMRLKTLTLFGCREYLMNSKEGKVWSLRSHSRPLRAILLGSTT